MVSLPKRKRARNAREEILDAAQRIVVRDGAARLTLDAVAREIGMTKGGVLYNFPTKADLLQGMLERMVDSFGRIGAATTPVRRGLEPGEKIVAAGVAKLRPGQRVEPARF